MLTPSVNVVQSSFGEDKQGEISGLSRSVSNLGSSLGAAIAGTILSEQGELMWVVTILHDLTEAIEKARLYDQLRQASAQLERKVQEATAELAEQTRTLDVSGAPGQGATTEIRIPLPA